MTGITALEVIRWSGRCNKETQKLYRNELQRAMQHDFSFAALLAADRLCKIMDGYKKAGWDPCAKGSLGAVELVGTLYSIGLGNPNAAPKSNKRGAQIAKWAREAKEMFHLPQCRCECK